MHLSLNVHFGLQLYIDASFAKIFPLVLVVFVSQLTNLPGTKQMIIVKMMKGHEYTMKLASNLNRTDLQHLKENFLHDTEEEHNDYMLLDWCDKSI